MSHYHLRTCGLAGICWSWLGSAALQGCSGVFVLWLRWAGSGSLGRSLLTISWGLREQSRNMQGFITPRLGTGTWSLLPHAIGQTKSHDEPQSKGVENTACLLLLWKGPQNHMTRDMSTVRSEGLSWECNLPQKAPLCASLVAKVSPKITRDCRAEI